MQKKGFDNKKYLEEQSEAILKRAKKFGNKLYLEFGGKLSNDLHAARVLPGFDPNVKIKLLQKLADKCEIIICIYSGDIERKKIRQDFGLAYDTQILRDIDDLHAYGLTVRGVVITRYKDQPVVDIFKTKLQRRGIKVFTHHPIPGYPNDVDIITSQKGYGKNEFIQTERPIVVVTAPGGGSGKLGTCLSQVYHENLNGSQAGYAKFETFPIWNLPLNHPVNIAYEASTADLGDINEIDYFHLETYKKTAINYNRDIEIFPVVKKILVKIMGNDKVYQSPTDMGVNRAGFAIIDDIICQEAAIQEVIRRYFKYSCEYVVGNANKKTMKRIEQIMLGKLDLHAHDRKVVTPARNTAKLSEEQHKGHDGIYVGAALELKDGNIICGNNSSLMHASSAIILNAIKFLSDIPMKIDLISRNVLDSIRKMKIDILNTDKVSLNLEETLIALSISATANPTAEIAMDSLKQLRGCEMHMTHIASPGDEIGLRRLGINLTSDPQFASKNLFVS
ncbi:hypothetical protein NEF87_001356 [Candidatus Lokiarchaeum ossiferum]|uniref:DUF1846 domain-containing protein n=1 Tax=Candidatus Lokiarchaeum ossiferum TaxID=2951803 RepID=A0ABY6HNI0_9ARCH|nr:hypothetical protein NEF87_001356 [Candidatus Lokiarchaeum sp. B-35]